MRKEFEMTRAQLDRLLDACRSMPYIITTGGLGPMSQQERANLAWADLGKEMGFQHMTVQPGRTQRHFTAEAVDE